MARVQDENQSRHHPPGPVTFAVLGDNRGDSTGEQPLVFRHILQAVNEAAPQLILHVGDMINGYPGDQESDLRRLWEGYREAIRNLKAPTYHAPGNHDVFDQVSARLWHELWGPTYYALDQHGIRFIALDTETEVNRLGEVQFAWLARRLEEVIDRPTFVFLHRPLFPVNGHRGLSLDMYPAQRDRLHQLFVRHRGIIQGVFQGHEHLYHFERRDGLPYYIVGGGGEELYLPRELGGFHHFLLVRIHEGKVTAEVHKAGEVAAPSSAVVTVAPESVLECWESTLFWYTWDQSVRKELTREHATEGAQGLKVWFDMGRYEWPALIVPLAPARDLTEIGAFGVDIYLPDGLLGLGVSLQLTAKNAHEAAPVRLQPRWNRILFELNDNWLPRGERKAVKEFQWILSAEATKPAGWVVFDNFRAEKATEGSANRGRSVPARPQPEVLLGLRESWEGRMLWGVWGETVTHEPALGPGSGKQGGVKVLFDFAKCDSPLLYASVLPLWDLTKVSCLTTDAFLPEGSAATLSINLALTANGVKYLAPLVSLVTGWNKVVIDLDAIWLAPEARNSICQLEWRLAASDKRPAGWIILGPLRTGPPCSGR